MKVIRILLSLLVLILVVLGVGLGALYYFVDPAKLKPVLVAEVKKRTGYDLLIDGKMGWTFYPYLAVSVPAMTLKSPQEATPIFVAKNVKLATDVRQLLHGKQKILGSVSISDLQLMNLHANNVKTDISWENNVLTLNPLRASLYHGSLKAQLSGQNLSSNPIWQWNVGLNDVQLQPLLADLNPQNKIEVSGVAIITMKAKMQGHQRTEMLQTLNGNLAFTLSNGSVQGVDLNYLAKAADAVLNKQPVPVPTGESATRFDKLLGAAAINNGIANITALHLTSEEFKTDGEGSLDLNSDYINMKLSTVPQATAKTKWIIPIIISGNLNAPDVKLDTDQLSKYAIKEQIDRVKDKAREAVEKHVPGQAGKYLQKLLSK